MDGLRRIVQALRLSSSQAERALGVSGAQLFVLQQLAGSPDASIRELAERTRTDPSSVSVVVQRLVQAGLVSRSPDPEDRRRAVLALTPAGARRVRRAPEPAQARLLEALRTLDRPELLRFTRTLDALAAQLGAPAAPASMFFEEPPRAGRPHREA